MTLTPPYIRYTVAELQNEASRRGLPDDGLKPDLVLRLEQYDQDVVDDSVTAEDGTPEVSAGGILQQVVPPDDGLTGAQRRNLVHDERREVERLAVEEPGDEEL